jgi:hypothetical protein
MKKVVFSLLVLALYVSGALAQAPADLKSDIYSKLECCACEIAFNKCGCKEAIEMKAYIDALIDSGLAQEEIFYKVAKKYTLGVIIDEQVKTTVRARLIKETGGKRPQIILEPAFFNFGNASKKTGSIRKIFKLYNKGNADLVITNIRVSCECVTASLKVGNNKSPVFGVRGAAHSGWQEVIKKGQSGELEVVMDLAHPSMEAGKKEIRDIFIASNDPLNSQLTLRVEIDVRE